MASSGSKVVELQRPHTKHAPAKHHHAVITAVNTAVQCTVRAALGFNYGADGEPRGITNIWQCVDHTTCSAQLK